VFLTDVNNSSGLHLIVVATSDIVSELRSQREILASSVRQKSTE